MDVCLSVRSRIDLALQSYVAPVLSGEPRPHPRYEAGTRICNRRCTGRGDALKLGCGPNCWLWPDSCRPIAASPVVVLRTQKPLHVPSAYPLFYVNIPQAKRSKTANSRTLGPQ